ncbi:hypothetical protein [Brevundimonas sp.]|uniref:hypothetical protein n=1 Tax=Brevundimonas sp. TaxID=1871086 RepID=UPI00286A8A78|nr:hypothetical protein [Brevundimonas sp.]
MRSDASHLSIGLAGLGSLACSAAALAFDAPGADWATLSGLVPVREARAHALAGAVEAAPARPVPVLQRDVSIMADPLANPAAPPTRERQRIAAPSSW